MFRENCDEGTRPADKSPADRSTYYDSKKGFILKVTAFADASTCLYSWEPSHGLPGWTWSNSEQILSENASKRETVVSARMYIIYYLFVYYLVIFVHAERRAAKQGRKSKRKKKMTNDDISEEDGTCYIIHSLSIIQCLSKALCHC